MPLRDKLERPLRKVIREQIAASQAPLGLRRLLFHPGKLARLCAQVEVMAAGYGVSGKLAALDVGGEGSPGFMEIVAFLMAHWDEILQLCLIILPLVMDNDGLTATEGEDDVGSA